MDRGNAMTVLRRTASEVRPYNSAQIHAKVTEQFLVQGRAERTAILVQGQAEGLAIWASISAVSCWRMRLRSPKDQPSRRSKRKADKRTRTKGNEPQEHRRGKGRLLRNAIKFCEGNHG